MLKIIDLIDTKELKAKDMDSIFGGYDVAQGQQYTMKQLPDSSDWPISYSISTKPIKNNYAPYLFAF